MFIVGELKDAHLAEKIKEDLSHQGIEVRIHLDEKNLTLNKSSSVWAFFCNKIFWNIYLRDNKSLSLVCK